METKQQNKEKRNETKEKQHTNEKYILHAGMSLMNFLIGMQQV